ncbi:dUTP diphosphatase [Bacillus luteolus]|uniref:dUTP diphosphatase n=1 Tax=Litchfieldia luteola TaxID=682179 RepID=A0ABR9QIA0_9BACI|nr:dUTP diphosphatase [Cytobacillus luteolus]MBE4908218.1 dUTP diphosphatase [Cytobacillus luteolus]MBP1943004.1 dimeric dUTPase (all-alpha-NTP-PPase superfamily) [Cytobacillus luteolus]
MNIDTMFELQKVLDIHIKEKHNLEMENLIERKILALLVEIGELANETRCFKFWSIKPPSSKEKILEEFVDGVHFILSIGLDLSYNAGFELTINDEELSLVDQFLSIYQRIADFQLNHTKETYKVLLSEYFNLGRLLGFTKEEIMFAYISKNEINHERQEQGY